MNDALRKHLELREKYGIPAKTRTRFAWLPVRCYTLKDRFIEPNIILWLRKVTEISSSAKEWIAYDKFQEIRK
jgi:hypothetical protein